MEQTPEAVWNACLDVIRDNIPRQSFRTWFGPLRAVSLDEEDGQRKLTVQLPSQFYYEWLEEHYYALLRKTITKVLGPTGRLYYKVVIERDDAESGHGGSAVNLPAHMEPGARNLGTPPPPQVGNARQAPTAPPAVPPGAGRPAPPAGVGPGPRRPEPGRPSAPPGGRPVSAPAARGPAPVAVNPFAAPGIERAPVDSNLNPTYVFERFIEGDCNRLARSAALAIAQSPGSTAFNPFLVYGGVGLGKTHLIQAIGNFAVAQQKARSCVYVSSERFTQEFVQSIKQNRSSEFSLFYRNVDVLIVDDIQFFAGKEKTQEEFFHVFNALHQSGKQIILSSDRPPREIADIEERLLSRFQWGLAADMQPPEFETRIAILERKAEDVGIDFEHDVLEFIAHNVKSNIRELEGALLRLIAQATLHRREVDVALTREVLRDFVKDARVSLTVEDLQGLVCAYFGIDERLLRDKTRKREVVQARQVAMYFCKQLTQHSLKDIGLRFGGRDHSTVIHAIQSVEDQLETDPRFREAVEEIKHQIELRGR
jgi:chromosomal replication initiator protein